jgi:hypothetical protein
LLHWEAAAMPLHWTIDARERLFVATAVGHVELDEVNRMLDAMVDANVHRYRKLFDGTCGDTRMNPFEILSIGLRMRGMHSTGPMGPLAVVFPDDKSFLISRILGILAAAKRPMRVFNDLKKARRWLDSPAIRASVPEPMEHEFQSQ